MNDAESIIRHLDLSPHPEGGWYRETWRGPAGRDGRAVGTAIHFLLRAGERSHWHRVDAAEIWYWHLGAPLELRICDTDNGTRTGNGDAVQTYRLGVDLDIGEEPHRLVPPNAWQAARSLGDFSLVSCSVSPGFDFSGFELAAPDWEPTPSG